MTSLWSDEQERPIRHIRVVDLTVMLTGPYVTRLLAQYGADVVKVERLPNGDPLRDLKNSSLFDLLNQGKKSLAADLKDPQALKWVKQLAVEADVFVENSRQGVLDKLGLGYGDLSELNPDLLYVSLRGFSGKRAALAGHDLNFISTSGCGEWFLESGHPNYSAFFADIVGGALVPLTKILFHLANPSRRGMHLISNMDEGFRSLYLSRAYDIFRSENLPEKDRAGFGAQNVFDGSLPNSRFYQCRDQQWLSLQAIHRKHWDQFCEIVDRREWIGKWQDPALVPELEKLFADAPASYWEALASERDVCLFRVIPWAEHLSHSQARQQLASDPFTWASFAPNPQLHPTPVMGQDTFAVLSGLGVPQKQMAEMLGSKILFQPQGK